MRRKAAKVKEEVGSDLSAWVQAVLTNEGLLDWVVGVLPPYDGGTWRGRCSYTTKQIALNTYRLDHGRYSAQVYAVLLHEIAHALVGPEHEHDVEWGIKYTTLVGRYMDVKLSTFRLV